MEGFIKIIRSNQLLEVLKIPPFLFLMLSEFFSQLAFNMQHFVIIFIVYELTKSNSSISWTILSFSLPALFLSIIAGVYVDRWKKKNVLVVTNLIRGFLILPFLSSSDLGLGGILFFTFLISVVTQFFVPAEPSIIPLIVPKKLLISANAVFGFGIYSTVFLGYILSGPALIYLGEQTTVIFLSVLFFIGTLLLIPLKEGENRVKPKITPLTTSARKEIHEMFRFLGRVKVVSKTLIILTLSQSILLMFAVLGPGYMNQILSVRVESLSVIILLPAAIGMGMGALILGARGSRLNLRVLSPAGFMLSGIIFILLPVGGTVIFPAFANFINQHVGFFEVTVIQIVIFMAFISGLANSFIFIPSNAIVQMNTNEEIRGKVYGLLNALVGAVSLLPVAAAGLLSDIFGVGNVIMGAGVAMVVASIVFLLIE